MLPTQTVNPHDLKDASRKMYVEASGNGSTDEQKFYRLFEFVFFPFVKPLLETSCTVRLCESATVRRCDCATV